MKPHALALRFLLPLLLWMSPATAAELGKQLLLPSPPMTSYSSQYSPWIMRQPGWSSTLMYFCKNTYLNNTYRDRIWRAEKWDGSATWSAPQLVLDGTYNAQDDLICSPGIAIDGYGTWHMYYVTQDRNNGPLHLYHATAPAPGLSWTKVGEVPLASGYRAYLETPSPMVINGRMVIYFIGGADQALYRMESTNSHNFTTPQRVNATGGVSHGRVTYANGIYYYTFSYSPVNMYTPPNTIYVATSTDGFNFTLQPPYPWMSSNGSDWDGQRMWSPVLHVQPNGERWIYYAGNNYVGPEWWGAYSHIGLRRFSP